MKYLVLAVIVLFSLSAQAADSYAMVGAGKYALKNGGLASITNVDLQSGGLQSTLSFTVGQKLSEHFAMELEYSQFDETVYNRLGSPVTNVVIPATKSNPAVTQTYYPTRVQYTARGCSIGIAGVGNLPLGSYGTSVFSRLGLNNTSFQYSNVRVLSNGLVVPPQPTNLAPSNSSKTSVSVGVGLQQEIGDTLIVRASINARSQKSTFDVRSAELSVGVMF